MYRGIRRVLCTLAVVGVPVSLFGQETSTRASVSEIRTAGTATRGVKPDLATIELQFFVDGSSPKEAGARVAMRADSLRRALVALGIPRDSLVSRSQWYWWSGRIEVRPQPARLPKRGDLVPYGQQIEPTQDTVYRAHDAIEVRVRDLTKLGAIMDSAMAHRITDISPIRYSVSSTGAIQDALLGEATRRARQQAEAIAAATGAHVGRVLSLSTQGDYTPRPGYALSEVVVSGMAGLSGGDGGTTVVQPTTNVSVTVFGRWELLAAP